MGLDVYMSILGFMILIIHRAALLITFPNRFKLRYSIGILIIALLLTSLFRNLTAGFIQWKGLSTFFNLILMLWLLKGSIFQIVFAYYFLYILTVVQLYITEAVLGVFIERTSQSFTLFLFIPMIVMYTVYVFLMVKYGKRIFQRLLVDGRTTEWALYAFGAVFSFIVLTVSRDYPNSALLNILLLLFIVWSFVVFCFAIINTHEKAKQISENELARGIVSSGREHYQKMDEMYGKLRTLRHDYKYHLTTIGELLAADNRTEIDRYLNDVQEQFSKIEVPIYCSNTVINALLVGYAERCAKLGIEYTVEVILPEQLPVPNYEMCIVLGNLLENAVEASQKADLKKIQLLLKPVSGELALRVRNSYDGRLNIIDGQVRSTKKDGGFGLRSVEAVAAQYGGELLTEWTDVTFTAYVAIIL